ncbi:hypothetical protein N7481_008567 [Penicillium waksmanii]|uniref:uncharacterized protein n=1 Tax=Penicillium waksmanii TaxID=69791 RepID=UPI0025491612|nr:uncharacterized protein N7481_008567 [Penicillium waksmanii]KAJ5974860.1 hypothetical protein N7481_008567 [Penicillium waksmanii]
MYRLFIYSTLISTVFGGMFQIIDHNNQCFVYSTGNFDCTGISESFAPLDGISCSTILCDSDQGTAWVEVHRSGLINFHNEEGDAVSCKVADPLVKGSLCTASNKARTSTKDIESQLTSLSTTTIHVSVTAPSAAPTTPSGPNSSLNTTDC